jgi:hypothetical protein
MIARLQSIRWIQEREYEVVVVHDAGQTTAMTCRVREDEGVRFVQSMPGLMDRLKISPRAIAAAVVAFDAAREDVDLNQK